MRFWAKERLDPLRHSPRMTAVVGMAATGSFEYSTEVIFGMREMVREM